MAISSPQSIKQAKSKPNFMSVRGLGLFACSSILLGAMGLPAAASPLFSRGYTVIPAPQKVNLATKDFEFARAWQLELGSGIKEDDSAVQSLKEQLQERFELTLGGTGTAAGVLHLAVTPNAVTIGAAADANKSALAE
jgi:hypothetical protein